MAHKQKTNKRQYAWVANGYVPDSRMLHRRVSHAVEQVCA